MTDPESRERPKASSLEQVTKVLDATGPLLVRATVPLAPPLAEAPDIRGWQYAAKLAMPVLGRVDPLVYYLLYCSGVERSRPHEGEVKNEVEGASDVVSAARNASRQDGRPTQWMCVGTVAVVGGVDLERLGQRHVDEQPFGDQYIGPLSYDASLPVGPEGEVDLQHTGHMLKLRLHAPSRLIEATFMGEPTD